jgi:SAM-dependent methyltransferase
MFTEVEKGTIRFYNQHGADWVRHHDTKRFWGWYIDRLAQLLPRGRLLEIGMGGGRDAEELRELGYDYVGIDISTGMFKLAQDRNEGIKVAQQSVYELAFPDDSFDGFWASATLLHLPKDRVGKALRELKRVVRRGGVGFVSVKDGDKDEVGGDGRYFANYRRGELEETILDSGLSVVESHAWRAKEDLTWRICFVSA